MSELVNAAAYERMIDALRAFEKNTLQITLDVANMTKVVKPAADPGEQVFLNMTNKMTKVISGMCDVAEKAQKMRLAMEETLEQLKKLERESQEE